MSVLEALSPPPYDEPYRAEHPAVLWLLEREVRRFSNIWRYSVVGPVLSTALFVVVFGTALGSHVDGVAGVSYGRFIVPGLFAQAIVNVGFFNGTTSLFEARRERYIHDVFASALRWWEIDAALVGGGVIRGIVVGGGVLLVVGPLTGGLTVAHPLVLVLGTLGVLLVAAQVGVIAGSLAKSLDHVYSMESIVLLPLGFLGGVFYSVRQLPQAWDVLSRFDPVFWLVQVERIGFLGHGDVGAGSALLAVWGWRWRCRPGPRSSSPPGGSSPDRAVPGCRTLLPRDEVHAMTALQFHWYLPTHGDSRSIGNSIDLDGPGIAQTRPATIDYLGQIARSAEQLGFEGALTPTGGWCDDAWITTAMLSQVTRRLKYLVAFRPGLLSPFLAAHQASTYQNLSGGRLLLNIVTGADDAEQRMYGDYLGKDERYERTGEFLHIVRALWRGEKVTFHGRHQRVDDAVLTQPPVSPPPVYFGGSSDAALPVAAKYADVYLTWGEPPAAVAEKIARVRQLAEAEGRQLRFGVRVHSIARETPDDAWREADRLLAGMSEEQIAKSQRSFAASASVGQQRMLALNKGSRDGLEIHPNLWAGVGLVRGGAGTALVGGYRQVADLVEEYASVGVSEFVLSGYPHLEEAYWFGEGVLPELARRGLWESTARQNW